MRISDWSSDVCSSDLAGAAWRRVASPLSYKNPRKFAMFGSIAKRFFGSSNDRYVTSLHKIVAKINALESQIEALDDAALQAQTPAFRARLDAGATLDDILPDALDRKSTRLLQSLMR